MFKSTALLHFAVLAVALFGATSVGPVLAQDVYTNTRVPPRSPKITNVGAIGNLSKDAIWSGMRTVPGLVKKAGIACRVTDAADLGLAPLMDSSGQSVGHVRLYEAACAEGLGYFVMTEGAKPPETFDCIAASQSGKLACMLPENSHPPQGLDHFLAAAGKDCHALRARWIGASDQSKVQQYEVACKEGGGYILDTPLPDGTGPAPVAFDCLQALANTRCLFTPHVESVAMLAHRIGSAIGDDCRVGDGRYVGYIAGQNEDLYEVSCQAGHDGLLVEVSANEKTLRATPCRQVKLAGVACTLKSVDRPDPLIIHAETSGASPPMDVTAPDWQAKPSSADLANLYPAQASFDRVTGQVLLSCTVRVTGQLEGCFAVDESPMGYGFASAALKMAAKFRMIPPTADGEPVSGEHVQIPIKFGVP